MERVAFLVERTGERISCLLNPEYLETRRAAGVAMRADAGGFLASPSRTDYPLVATGGGITEIDMRLLFDVSIAQSDRARRAAVTGTDGTRAPSEDVRELTRPFWDLAENAASEGVSAPPVVRFIWGKSWNVPGVVVNVAERLEQFDADGTPRRSWLSLRLRRVEESEPHPSPQLPVTPQFELPAPESETPPGEFPALEIEVDEFGGPQNRLDQIAAEHYGSPAMARLLAAFNGLQDLLSIETGTMLNLPPITQLWRRQ